MNKKRIWLVLLFASVAMMLLTIYLAIFFAPLTQTGVKSANEILAQLEGSEMKVAGFVAKVYDTPQGSTAMALADFIDYQKWRDFKNGTGSSEWWTTLPIDVAISSDVPSVVEGKNLSVEGVVTASIIGNFSSETGFSISGAAEDIEVGVAPGQFELMTAPVAQKIFYFHMPSAWVSYLAFFTTLVASIFYLKRRDLKYDRLAQCAAELGILFATIAIATGPIWAKEEWGVYWRWEDSKLTTTFILWLAYLGYLSLRSAISEHSSRARVSAVYGILAFATVPMSLLASRIEPLLGSSHPQVIATSSGGLSPAAGMTVGMSIIAFTLLFITLLNLRIELASRHEKIEELKRLVGGED